MSLDDKHSSFWFDTMSVRINSHNHRWKQKYGGDPTLKISFNPCAPTEKLSQSCHCNHYLSAVLCQECAGMHKTHYVSVCREDVINIPG